MTGYDETTPPPPLSPFEEIANEAKRREFVAKIKELEARVNGTERAQQPRLTASTISDDDLDRLYAARERDTATLAEIRRVVEKARHTRTGSQAADVVMQALTANLLGILGPAPETT